MKSGYRKSDRRQYEHRSPRTVLDQLVEELDSIGAGGRLFSTEGLIGEGSARLSDHPTYQVYLCLAFLVHHGLLVKMGRQGYTIAASARTNFRVAVQDAFASLPTQ